MRGIRLSYRDVGELLAERGVKVDHVTVLPVGASVTAFRGRGHAGSHGGKSVGSTPTCGGCPAGITPTS
jgi:hypothetical protein